MILNLNVDNQKMESANNLFMADYNQNIIICQFDFNGDDWEDKQKFALLKNTDGDVYQLHIEDDEITLPADIMQGNKFSISLYGEDSNNARITTNILTFRLNPSGYTTDIADLEDVSEDIWTQIFDGIDSKSDSDHTHTVSDVTDFPTLADVATSGDYMDLENIPSTFTPSNHTHIVNDITDFPDLSTVATSGSYSDLENIPSTFNPSEHSHSINEISNLQNSLDAKVNVESGKTLTTNDFTDTYKDKVDDYWSSVSKNITSSDISNWNAKQDTSNLVTEFSTNPSDTMYPSEKLVKDYIDELIGNISEYVNR